MASPQIYAQPMLPGFLTNRLIAARVELLSPVQGVSERHSIKDCSTLTPQLASSASSIAMGHTPSPVGVLANILSYDPYISV